MTILTKFKTTFPQQYEQFTKVSSIAVPAAVKAAFKTPKQKVTRMDLLIPKTLIIWSSLDTNILSDIFTEIFLTKRNPENGKIIPKYTIVQNVLDKLDFLTDFVILESFIKKIIDKKGCCPVYGSMGEKEIVPPSSIKATFCAKACCSTSSMALS